MPYYVHPKTLENLPERVASIEDGTATDYNSLRVRVFTSRQDAHRASAEDTDLTVSFVISSNERREWKRREYERFTDGAYARVPWEDSHIHYWEPTDDPDNHYGVRHPIILHFPHLSIKTPGNIAYTPDDEHGYQDRQVTVKVGRYLEKYCTGIFTRQQIAEFIDRVKAFDGDLQIARTAEDIVSVYRNGPTSCMSHCADDYATNGVHPVSVYGDSDLGVAYLGSLSAPTARCLVWPDRKLFSRCYGDTTLEQILTSHGYSKAPLGNGDCSSSHGSFAGAKIRAVKVRGRSNTYVMPYLDCADSADLVDKGTMFLLYDEDHEGEYTVHDTDGVTGENTRCSCSNCGSSCDEDEDLCSSCQDDVIYCERCNERSFDTDNMTCVNDSWYCDSCAERWKCECEGCGDTWYEKHPDSSFCSSCDDHWRHCDECGDAFDTGGCDDPDSDHCDSCYEAPEDEDEDEHLHRALHGIIASNDTDTIPLPIPDLQYPIIDDRFFVRVGAYPGTPTIVEPLRVQGALAIHLKIEDDDDLPRYTISHVETGLAIFCTAYYTEALSVIDLLVTPGTDWSIVGVNERGRPLVSDATHSFAKHVCEHKTLPTSAGAVMTYIALQDETAEVPCAAI